MDKHQPFKLDPKKLIRAAKTSIVLFELYYDTMWRLFPDAVIALSDESEEMLVAILTDYIQDTKKI